MRKALRKILSTRSTESLSDGNRQPGSTTVDILSSQDAVVGTSEREVDPQEAAAGTNDATSGVTTALLTRSDVASPTVSALSGERTSSVAASGGKDRT